MLTVPKVAVVAVAYTVVHMSKYTGEVEEEVCDISGKLFAFCVLYYDKVRLNVLIEIVIVPGVLFQQYIYY